VEGVIIEIKVVIMFPLIYLSTLLLLLIFYFL